MNLESNLDPREFWFNLNTKQVELGKQSAAPFRVGPFKTRAEAERALEIIAERAKQWRKDDEGLER